jgi:hypothetical protein
MGLARAFADNVLAVAMDAQLTLSDEERTKVTCPSRGARC